MTDQAKTTFGAELWMGASGGSLTKVAELTSINPPKRTRGTIDVTSHDSAGGAMEFIGSAIYDPGEVSGSGFYVAGSTGDDALVAAIVDGATRDFKVVLKSAADTEDLTFAGIVTEYGPDEMGLDGAQTFSFTVKVTSAITQAASA